MDEQRVVITGISVPFGQIFGLIICIVLCLIPLGIALSVASCTALAVIGAL